GIETKVGFFKAFVVHYYNLFKNNNELKKQYNTFLDYFGETLIENEKFKTHLDEFDYIARQELIDIFSDFCADLEINVYSTDNIPDYSLDLYLIRRTPLLRTEAVFVRTGADMELLNYENTLNLIQKASKIATWTVFVTTPYGVYKIGLNRIIKNMERLNVWLYMVNPMHKRIHGVTKGKKSKDHDIELRDKFIEELPREPIRAPSKVLKISKYGFSEGESYKSKNYSTYELWIKNEIEIAEYDKKPPPKYKDIFQNLLIIDIESGLSLFSYSSEFKELDDSLVSGFLSAMDSFVSELGATSSLKEMNYKGFFIQAVHGKFVKIALFLSKPGDKILKERLAYLIKQFEEKYKDQIKNFRTTGRVSFFDKNEEILSMIKKTLET
ncbi:MAG: hypothetical protein ACTSUT_12000, partial [Promethearchaeota archaeon]